MLALAVAASLTAATGARRTDTAFSRALTSADAADANVSVDASNSGAKATRALDALERSSLITGHGRYGAAIFAAVRDGKVDERYNSTSATAYMPFDTRAGVTISRYRVLRGRTASPERADEVVVNEAFVRATGNDVGDTPAGLRVFSFDDYDESGAPDPRKGTPITVTVVGVVQPPEAALADLALRIYTTPATTARFKDAVLLLPGAASARARVCRSRTPERTGRPAAEPVSQGGDLHLLQPRGAGAREPRRRPDRQRALDPRRARVRGRAVARRPIVRACPHHPGRRQRAVPRRRRDAAHSVCEPSWPACWSRSRSPRGWPSWSHGHSHR